jgi:murein DD-endopeptidase MepM/ murein hydrolase activator NlpD
VVKHDPLVSGGEVYYSRYAHGEDIRATEGDRVQRGEMLGRVGSGGGLYPYHLHFDIVKTDVLEDKPGHWPGMNRTELLAHYVNPRTFIQDNRPKQR